MYCTKCGQEVSEFDIYCPHCRGKVKQEPLNDNFLDFEELNNDKTIDDLLNVDVQAQDPSEEEENDMDKEYEQYKENVFNKNKNRNSIDFEDFDFDDEEDEKGLLANKILIILIVIAFVTATGLAVKFLYLNDDGAQTPQDNTPNQVENGDEQQTGDQEPSNPQDKENGIPTRQEIFGNLASVNTNIQEVKDNLALKYDSDVQYKVLDIKHSAPLDTKLYKEVGGKKAYHEESIIRSLVQFNSKWIDYVNNDDQAVISLVQKGSKAYKNVTNFSKKNKLQEFLLFEIGEIRKGEDGYYVWTHEKIKEVQNGESKIKEYSWIYHLVEGEYDFFIASYYR